MCIRKTSAPVLISACLLGINCRYDGGNSLDEELVASAQYRIYIPVCPESFGGMPIPRVRCQIVCGDGNAVLQGRSQILGEDNVDYTKQFLKGARETAHICNLLGITEAILKDKSPSCGSQQIYQNDVLCNGMGVTTANLHQMGIKINAR